MKISFFKPILLLAMVSFAAGCSSDNDDTDAQLELDASSYTVVTGQESYFTIKQGSGVYEIAPEDESIVRGGYSGSDKSPGSLVLTGLKPGHTNVKVTDKVTGDHTTVEVYVHEPYFAIRGAESTEAQIRVLEGTDLPAGLKEELEKNEPLGSFFNLVLLQNSDRLFVEINKGSLVSLYEGTYIIKGTITEPWLEIAFDNGTEEITAEYLLPQSPGLQYLLAFLDPGLAPAGTRDVGPDYYVIVLSEYLTTKVSQEYTNIVSASLDIYSVCARNKFMNNAVIKKFY